MNTVALHQLDARIETASRHLREAVAAYPDAILATSFGAEDMVLLDLVERLGLRVDAFTLDTGRLNEETYALMERARKRYGTRVRVMAPDTAELEAFVAEHGVNAFYDSVEMRKRCCGIRKMGPLRRALSGRSLWITGLRREQSVTRADVRPLETDDANGLLKLSPLVDWSAADVDAYVKRFEVPVNELHAKGFPSIGCAPCTRAVRPGEDDRAGRWWWEQPENRECGLHVGPDGRLVRTVRIVPADTNIA